MKTIKNIINEELNNLFVKNTNKFPISALVKQAKNFKNFEDFEHLYSINIYHGYYWHWTVIDAEAKTTRIYTNSAKRLMDKANLRLKGVGEDVAVENK